MERSDKVEAARWNQRQDAAIKSAIEYLIEGAKISKFCCDNQTLPRRNLSRHLEKILEVRGSDLEASRRLDKILEPAPDQNYVRHLLRRNDLEVSRRLDKVLEPVPDQSCARSFVRGNDFRELPRLSTLEVGRAKSFNDAEIQTSRSLEIGALKSQTCQTTSDNPHSLSEIRSEVVESKDAAFERRMDELISGVVSKWLQSACPFYECDPDCPAGSSSPDRLRLCSSNNQLTGNLRRGVLANSAVKRESPETMTLDRASGI